MSRMIQLDILRGFAILLVLGQHFWVAPSRAGWLQAPLDRIHTFGWTGVDLFFVLSGYLVGGLLMAELRKTGRIAPGRFLIRRAFKIWPGYLVFLAFVCVGESIKLSGIPTMATLGSVIRGHWPSFLHVQNYYMETIPRAPHTWSLAVEEHFYLAVPFVLLALARWRSAVPVLAVLLMVGCAAARYASLRDPFDLWAQVYTTHLRIDSLFFGVCLAYLAQFHPERFAALGRHPRILLVLGLALIAPMTVLQLTKSTFVQVVGFTCLAVGYGCLLVLAVQSEPGVGIRGRLMETRAARAVAWVGVASYPIYVWHVALALSPINRVVRYWSLVPLPDTALVLLTAGLYLALAIGPPALLGWLIDRPMLRLRDRLFPARVSSSPRPAAVGSRGDSLPSLPAEPLLTGFGK